VKLIDFWLAMIDDETMARFTRQGHVLGTDAYMAPECARGGTPTPAADVYSLACTSFELLTGAMPFQGTGMDGLIAKTQGSPRKIDEFTRDPIVRAAGPVIERALSRDSAARPTASEFLEELRAALERSSRRGDATIGDLPTAPRIGSGPRPAPAPAPAPNQHNVMVWLCPRRVVVVVGRLGDLAPALTSGVGHPVGVDGNDRACFEKAGPSSSAVRARGGSDRLTTPARMNLLSPPRSPLAPVLQDRFGRRFPYLRLSVTDVCNFRCTYCLPEGHTKSGVAEVLSVDEIGRLVAAFATLGTHKVRLTGGEPTLRRDFVELAARVASVPGIRTLAMTTNGYRLPERAAEFFAAGIRSLNVSVDSLDPSVFRSLTGHARLAEVLSGIDRALEVGFSTLKLNAVLLRGINDDGLPAFLRLVKERPLSLRFIELMQTRDNADYFRLHHRAASEIREQLSERGWSVRIRQDDAGPAQVYEHPDYQGTIGLIAPYEPGFCDTCNRLRVTARGELHLCLFGEHGHDLRPLLSADDQAEALGARIEGALQLKRSGHFLRDGDPGIRGHFAAIGG